MLKVVTGRIADRDARNLHSVAVRRHYEPNRGSTEDLVEILYRLLMEGGALTPKDAASARQDDLLSYVR